MILESLLANLDDILPRITTSHLQRYNLLQRELQARAVDSDREYQSAFNGFYKMQRRTEEWYRYFFSILEEEKHNNSVTFEQILKKVYAEKIRVEPSFSSKLVATIRPDMPVYDKHIRENLALAVPPQYKPAGYRIQGFLSMYSTLQGKVASLIVNPIFTTTIKPAFDKRYPAYKHFSDVKKLDFLLWQHRNI